MNPHKPLTIIAILCLGSAATSSAQQNHEELKQRILAQAQSLSPDDYAFTRTVRSEITFNGNIEQETRVERFDPARPADARWTLVSVNGAPPSRAALQRYRKEAGKRRVVPGYHRLGSYFGSAATGSAGEGGKTVFHFAALPNGAVSILNTDFARVARAEVSVSAANGQSFAEQVRFTVTPTSSGLFAKVNPFQTVAHYRIGPTGTPLLVESRSEMTASMMGMEGAMRNTMTYSDYQAIGNQR